MSGCSPRVEDAREGQGRTAVDMEAMGGGGCLHARTLGSAKRWELMMVKATPRTARKSRKEMPLPKNKIQRKPDGKGHKGSKKTSSKLGVLRELILLLVLLKVTLNLGLLTLTVILGSVLVVRNVACITIAPRNVVVSSMRDVDMQITILMIARSACLGITAQSCVLLRWKIRASST